MDSYMERPVPCVTDRSPTPLLYLWKPIRLPRVTTGMYNAPLDKTFHEGALFIYERNPTRTK